jgi:hypothetical protein
MRRHRRYFHEIPELDVARILAVDDGDEEEDEEEEEEDEHGGDQEEEEEEVPVWTC